MREKIKQLWNKACEHDGIDPKSKFVVFSEGNPFAKEYNQTLIAFTLARTY